MLRRLRLDGPSASEPCISPSNDVLCRASKALEGGEQASEGRMRTLDEGVSNPKSKAFAGDFSEKQGV
jgi:hypothetical protein